MKQRIGLFREWVGVRNDWGRLRGANDQFGFAVTMGWILALLWLVAACVPDADQSGKTSPATLTVSASMANVAQPASAARALLNTPPPAITSIVIRVYSAGSEIAAGDIVASGGVLQLSVPPGLPFTVIGTAYEAKELRFRGETSILPLLPGLSATVTLSLTPAADLDFTTPVQVDITASGESANGPSTGAVFADGNRKVLFWSTANNLVPGDANQTRNLYIKDLVSGLVVDVDRGVNGEVANGPAGAADINSAGTLVAFGSAAGNLVANGADGNGVADIFLRDLTLNQTQLLSLTESRASAAAPSQQPALSDDGQWVFFESDAELAKAGERGIFLFDRTANVLRFIGAGRLPRVSADRGTLLLVYWDAQAQALKLRDFLVDSGREQVIVQPYSVPAEADPSLPGLFTPYSISANGKFIAYALPVSAGSQSVAGVYLYNHFAAGARTRLISVETNGQALPVPAEAELLPSLSADGRFVAFALGTTVYVKDTVTGELTQLSEAGTKATISDDGRLIAYSASPGQNLFVIRNPIVDAAPTPGNVPAVSFEMAVTGSGQVATLDGALSCPGAACALSVPTGALLTLKAQPSTGFEFQSWGGDCSGTQNPLVFTAQGNARCSATFLQVRRSLTLTIKGGPNAGRVVSNDGPPPTLSCNSDAPDTVCSASFPAGTSVTLVPTLAGNSNVVVWQGCDTDNGLKGCTVVLNGDRPVTAAFGTQSFAVQVGRGGNGNGVITSSDGNINCGATCNRNYIGGTSVTLTAQPDANSTFSNWSGDCTGADPTFTVTVNKAISCTAVFTLASRTLTVTKGGTGAGTVASEDGRINCGGTCRAVYSSGTTVRLSATPSAGSVFAGWSGGCSGASSPTSVLVDRNRTCTATFDLQTFALTVTKAGTGAGTVTSQPAGIDCGATCTANFTVGQSVTLTATAATGSVFGGWGGACTATNGTTATITMDAAKSCTASFTRRFGLAVVFAGSGGGKVDIAPPGSSCTSNCSQSLDAGTAVTLTAQADANSQFGGWSGDCASQNNVANVTMDSAKSCTAQFLATFALTVTKAGNGEGLVTSDDKRIDCGPTCTASYIEGTSVTLTASPLNNATFAGWSGGCTGSAATPLTAQVTIAAATECIATFDFNIVILNQTLPASPARNLLFVDLVAVEFSYQTSVTSGAQVVVEPLTLGALTPGANVGVFSVPAGTGAGAGAANFTVLAGASTSPVAVDQLRLTVIDVQKKVLTESILPVDFLFQ